MADDSNAYGIGPVAYRTGQKAYGPPDQTYAQRQEQLRPITPDADPGMALRPPDQGRIQIQNFNARRLQEMKDHPDPENI